jgi:hypothetical protein
MTLDQWLTEHNLSNEWLVAQLDTSRTNVSKWRRGVALPSLYFAQAISRATGGEVGLFDWPAEQPRTPKTYPMPGPHGMGFLTVG